LQAFGNVYYSHRYATLAKTKKDRKLQRISAGD